MKKKYKVILLLSLLLNLFFIGHYVIRGIKLYQAYRVKDIPYPVGLKVFFDSLDSKHPGMSEKKIFYINIWSSVCKPCIEEMPFLDSLAGTLDQKRVGYVYVTDDEQKTETDFLSTHRRSSNFVHLSGMNAFISSVCIEKNRGNKQLPMHLLIDRSGKILYFKVGTFDRLTLKPGHTKQQEQDAQRFNTPPFVAIINAFE